MVEPRHHEKPFPCLAGPHRFETQPRVVSGWSSGCRRVSGGERVTDNLEVFPKVTADATGHFHVRFFLHGLRHLGDKAIERAAKLEVGEELRILVELNNPATRLAVPLLTDDYQMIGWAPRYLVDDLINCVPHAPELSARVARINADAAPLNQRILIDYAGRAPMGTQPMSTPDFKPLMELRAVNLDNVR